MLDPNALIYIPYLRVNCLKTIPFTATHTYIAHVWQYPPGVLTYSVTKIKFDTRILMHCNGGTNIPYCCGIQIVKTMIRE